jgi:hypothetical protein
MVRKKLSPKAYTAAKRLAASLAAAAAASFGTALGEGLAYYIALAVALGFAARWSVQLFAYLEKPSYIGANGPSYADPYAIPPASTPHNDYRPEWSPAA